MAEYLDFASTVLADSVIDNIANKQIADLDFHVFAQFLAQIKEFLLRADGGEKFLTDEESAQVNSVLQNLPSVINQISTLMPTMGNLNTLLDTYNALLLQVQSMKNTMLKNLTRAVTFANPSDPKSLLKFYETFKEYQEQANLLIALQQQSVEKNALTESSEFFHELFKKYRWSSYIYGFLLAITITGFSIITYNSTSRFTSISSSTNPYVNSLPLVTLLGLGWFSLRTLTRNLKFAQKQMALNRTKTVLLQSGEKFAASSSVKDIQSQITWVIVQNVYSLNELGSGNEENELLSNLQGIPSFISKFAGGS